jgi:hypothetical protein
MIKDIVELKRLFRSLSQLKVSELKVPQIKYYEILDTFHNNTDSLDLTAGQGIRSEFRFNDRGESIIITPMMIFGVRLEIEGYDRLK